MITKRFNTLTDITVLGGLLNSSDSLCSFSSDLFGNGGNTICSVRDHVGILAMAGTP